MIANEVPFGTIALCSPENHPLLRFTPLDDPDAIRLWQRTLCDMLSLKGRILISRHGINGTLGGTIEDLKRYIAATKDFSGFRGIDFKWSEGSADDFPRLRIRVRDEIVSFGAADELSVDRRGVVGGGVHLKPDDVHELVQQRGDDVVFFDARNAFEAAIGRFKNAVVPNVLATRDFASVLDSGRYDHLKHKAVVTYCTGGVRCEVLSALMIKRGFEEVYHSTEASCATAKPSATTASGGLVVPLRRTDASRVQRAHEDNRHVRTMRGSHESVPQLREPGLSKVDSPLWRLRTRQRQYELRAAALCELGRRQCERARRRTKRLKGKSSGEPKLAGGFLTITGYWEMN